MSAAEAPKSEQIQANVAAALSRLRGELGAASSPVASPTPIPLPKVGAEPVPPEPMPEPVALAPLPAGPVRTPETSGAVRPFEPILNAMSAGNSNSAPSNDAAPAPVEGAKPDLFGRLRADPSLTTDRAAAAAMLNASEAKPDSQPDLLTGMEVPPAPPPPLGSFEAEDEVNGRGRRMRNRLMVLAAIVVIAGGAAWAWVSSHRTPEGPVPVIAADTSPEKVKPDDEGGMQVPNQNVEILNGQATTDEQPAITPPPEQPVSPPMTETTDEANAASQAPVITDAPKPAEPTPPAATDAVPSVDAPAIPSVSAPEPGQTAAAPAPVVSEAETQQAAPAPAEPAPAPATTAEKPAEPTAAAAATSTAKAPEPAPAPKAEPTQTAAAPVAPAAPSVAPTAGGAARIQLAAVKSEALAQSEWAKLQKAHPALLGGLTLNVQAVDKNGSKLYRIQAGPLTKAQAKDLCTQLKAQKQDCIVAK
ncbi:SPOR domain-containing protein [Dongia sp.]|uniref:SPOR domain-containing protein n=1 Tax=Dongia sp. TaxID=1977262 RepID=UPI00375245BB